MILIRSNVHGAKLVMIVMETRHGTTFVTSIFSCYGNSSVFSCFPGHCISCQQVKVELSDVISCHYPKLKIDQTTILKKQGSINNMHGYTSRSEIHICVHITCKNRLILLGCILVYYVASNCMQKPRVGTLHLSALLVSVLNLMTFQCLTYLVRLC